MRTSFSGEVCRMTNQQKVGQSTDRVTSKTRTSKGRAKVATVHVCVDAKSDVVALACG